MRKAQTPAVLIGRPKAVLWRLRRKKGEQLLFPLTAGATHWATEGGGEAIDEPLGSQVILESIENVWTSRTCQSSLKLPQRPLYRLQGSSNTPPMWVSNSHGSSLSRLLLLLAAWSTSGRSTPPSLLTRGRGLVRVSGQQRHNWRVSSS